MSHVHKVVEYNEEGFAILSDDAGDYLVFQDTDRFESVNDFYDNYPSNPRPRVSKAQMSEELRF